MVITFLICNIPDAFVKIWYIMKTVKSTAEPPQWFLLVVTIRNFILVLNSAINSLIYTCLSKKFRNEIRRALWKLTGNDIALASRTENSIHVQPHYGLSQQNFNVTEF